MGSSIKRIQYRYDSVGNRIGMTDPDGGRFTYVYDSVNRIKEVVNPQGERTTYDYDPGGRRTVKKLANGTRASFSYDAASNLTRLANLKSDGTTISSFDYDYNKVGNRTAVQEADGSRVTWSYDATYQLTGEHRTGSTPYRDTYTYDASGNRLLKIHDGARTTSAYDAASQLIYSEDASGRTTYTFDADGNQEVVEQPSGERTTYAWDYENRMTSVRLPSGVRNTMAYDADGLRVKLEESTGTKKFVWDEQNYLAETDDNDDTQSVYTHAPKTSGTIISQRHNTNTHWYHFDISGSTRQLTDLSAATAASYDYDSWGTLIAVAGPPITHFLYKATRSYYFGADIDDYYVRDNNLTPSLGRWLSIHPSTVIFLAGQLYACQPIPGPTDGPDDARQETDGKVLITSDPKRQVLADLSCPEANIKLEPFIVWLFRVNPAPKGRAGYFIQKVDISCVYNDCSDCDQDPVEYTYYEVFRRDEKGKMLDNQQFSVNGITVVGTDIAYGKIVNGTCGEFTAKGEVRLFLKTDETKEVEQWQKNQTYPKSQQNVGKSCMTGVGDLHSSEDEPDWWGGSKSVGRYESALRVFDLSWDCCNNCNNFVLGNASPLRSSDDGDD